MDQSNRQGRTLACMYVCVCVCVCVCMYVYVRSQAPLSCCYLEVCVCMCMYVRTCMCVHTVGLPSLKVFLVNQNKENNNNNKQIEEGRKKERSINSK